jgi:hypothetical protein
MATMKQSNSTLPSLRTAFFLGMAVLLGILPKSSYAAATGSGWQALPDTHLKSVCPANSFNGSSYRFTDQCASITACWNSGAFDDVHNRLIIWGGGHTDYSGNEIYALDLNQNKMVRLNDPGLPVATDCAESIVGGTQPNSRHTYDGIAYMSKQDRLFAIGGSRAVCGGMSNATWTFDFKTSKWQAMNPTGTIPNSVPGIMTVYDTATGKVWVRDDKALYSYDLTANRYERLFNDISVDYHLVASMDPKRRQIILLGGKQQWIIDLKANPPTQKNLNSTGANALVQSNYPGLAYDPVEDRMIGWTGGDTVYVLDLDTRTWTPTVYPGGPKDLEYGTYGRWDYVPKLNAMVVVNSATENAYLLYRSPTTAIKAKPQMHRKYRSLKHGASHLGQLNLRGQISP